MYKYKAFISYSHADIAFGRWLQKKIENYKIPKSLREKYPNLPKDLKRSVFRDEEDLAIGANLPDKLTKALNQSEFLIVITSPNAVASEWVNKEIAYFKSYHGEDRVLAMMKEGEPSEAFPKALRYQVDKHGELTEIKTEPLAGDARNFWVRKRGVIKLIAELLKVDFADLWEREKVETRKRIMVKIGFAILLLGAMWFGYDEYKTNQKIQGHGVDFVQFSQKKSNLKQKLKKATTDEEKIALWKKIEEVNKKLKEIEEIEKNIANPEDEIVKKGVEIYKEEGAKEALNFLNSQEIEKHENKEVKALSERWRFKANMYRLENRYEEAKKIYEKVVTIDFSYSNVLEYAYFLYKQNSFKRAIELNQKLQQTKLSKEQKAVVLNNLASLYYKVNRVEEAKKAYLEALKIYRALAKTNPQAYNSDVADTLNNLALLYDKVNRVKEAEEAYLKSLKIRRTLAKTNPQAYNSEVSMTLNNLASLYDKVNRVKEAEEAYLEALKIRRALAKINPQAYNYYVSTTLNNLALLYDKVKRVKEAEEAYLEALKIYRALAKTNPQTYNFDVSTTLNNLAILYDKVNRVKEAEEAYLEALKIRRALAKTNPQAYGIDLANSLVMGVDLLNQPIENLNEAENILKSFRGIPKAEQLLKIIEMLRKKAK